MCETSQNCSFFCFFNNCFLLVKLWTWLSKWNFSSCIFWNFSHQFSKYFRFYSSKWMNLQLMFFWRQSKENAIFFVLNNDWCLKPWINLENCINAKNRQFCCGFCEFAVFGPILSKKVIWLFDRGINYYVIFVENCQNFIDFQKRAFAICLAYTSLLLDFADQKFASPTRRLKQNCPR